MPCGSRSKRPDPDVSARGDLEVELKASPVVLDHLVHPDFAARGRTYAAIPEGNARLVPHVHLQLPISRESPPDLRDRLPTETASPHPGREEELGHLDDSLARNLAHHREAASAPLVDDEEGMPTRLRPVQGQIGMAARVRRADRDIPMRRQLAQVVVEERFQCRAIFEPDAFENECADVQGLRTANRA